MNKKRRRKHQQLKKQEELFGAEFGQDEHFFFIAGFTEGGAPYGITWEEAYEDGLIEEDEPADVRRRPDESLPF